MKSVTQSFIIAATLVAAANAHAWLGDAVPALTNRYGPPLAVERSTGAIPTSPAEYVELRDVITTNAIWMAPPKNGHYLELIEQRVRYLFHKDGLGITAYVGDPNEKYDGIDFTGKSAREIIDCPVTWQTNLDGDKVGVPVPFTTAAVDSFLVANKGNSVWSNEWQTIVIPGRFVKFTTDKSREAIAYGASTNQVTRVEIKMVNPISRTD